MGTGRLGTLLWLWLTAAPWAVHAQTAPVHGAALNWVRLPGAESCITSAELAHRVEERLERRVFVLSQEADVAFDGYVQPRSEGGFAAHLSISNAAGQVLGARDVDSQDHDCRSLDDALVLITALTLFPGDLGLPSGGIALDSETSARLHALFGDEPSELDPSELPEHSPASPAAAPESTPTATPSATEPARSVSGRDTYVDIEAGPLAALGVLPGLSVGVSAEITVATSGLWPLRIGVSHFFERTAGAESLASAEGRFEREELTLFACPVSGTATLQPELCGGAAFGLMRAQGDGFTGQDLDAIDPVFDLGARAGLRLQLPQSLLLRASLTALLPVVRRAYEFQALDASNRRLFRSAQVAGRLQIALGAQF